MKNGYFLELKLCSNVFEANFGAVFAWEKSMLFEGYFLIVWSPDYGHYISANVDGAKSFE